MKTGRRSCKKQIGPKTSDSLRRRLAAYSATAGAALMAVPVADAAIHNITTFSYDSGNTYSVTPPDVSGNPINALHSILFTGATAGTNHAAGFHGALAASRFSGSPTQRGYAGIKCSFTSILATFNGNKALNLSFDAPIAGGTNFINGSLILASRSVTSGGTPIITGSFRPNGNSAAKTGYLGFRSGGAGHTYYGWLRVKVINDGSGLPIEVTLTDKNNDGIYGAFGLASDNIKAGQIASVPEPSVAGIGGLGLLALGAVGVRELRRRRQAQEKA